MGRIRTKDAHDDSKALLEPRKNGFFGKRALRSEDVESSKKSLRMPSLKRRDESILGGGSGLPCISFKNNNIKDEYLPLTAPPSPELDVIVLAMPGKDRNGYSANSQFHEDDITTVSNLTESLAPRDDKLLNGERARYNAYSSRIRAEDDDPKGDSLYRCTVIEKVLGLMEDACNGNEQSNGKIGSTGAAARKFRTPLFAQTEEDNTTLTGPQLKSNYTDDQYSSWRYTSTENDTISLSLKKGRGFPTNNSTEPNTQMNLGNNTISSVASNCNSISHDNFEIVLEERKNDKRVQARDGNNATFLQPSKNKSSLPGQFRTKVGAENRGEEEKKEEFYDNENDNYSEEKNDGRNTMYKRVFGAGPEEVTRVNQGVRLVDRNDFQLERISEEFEEDEPQESKNSEKAVTKEIDEREISDNSGAAPRNTTPKRKKIIPKFVKRFSRNKKRRNRSANVNPIDKSTKAISASSPATRSSNPRPNPTYNNTIPSKREYTKKEGDSYPSRFQKLEQRGTQVPGLAGGDDKLIQNEELLGEEMPQYVEGTKDSIAENISEKQETLHDGNAEETDVGNIPIISSSGNEKKMKSKWKSAVDPKTGRCYYYHRVTRKTTWVKPPDFKPQSSRNGNKTTEVDGETREIEMRKKDGQDFDPYVWKTKKEIMVLFRSLSLPKGANGEKLLNQYEGKESELLRQLKDLIESKPFDEPIEASSGSASSNPKRIVPFVRTAISQGTKMSEQTETTDKICNRARKVAVLDSMQINNLKLFSVASSATSMSSHAGDELAGEGFGTESRKVVLSYEGGRIPNKLPVHRSRDLMVEEFPSDRIAKEMYNDMKGTQRKSPSRRNFSGKVTQQPLLEEGESSCYYGGDDSDASSADDVVSKIEDSISALSDMDTDFERARRRALDVAVERKDWELAAALCEGKGQGRETFSNTRYENSEWTQTELDRFISENDWDAVGEYIAHMRDMENEKKNPSSGNNRRVSTDNKRQGITQNGHHNDAHRISPLRARKKFGARSQLQHHEIPSDASSSTDSSGSEEVSTDYFARDYGP